MSQNQLRSAAKWSVLALSALAVLIVWEKPHVAALDGEVQALVDLCESPGGHNRKAMAVQELCDTDTADSKRALKLLATSGDDRVAMLALAALAREDFSGAEGAITEYRTRFILPAAGAMEAEAVLATVLTRLAGVGRVER